MDFNLDLNDYSDDDDDKFELAELPDWFIEEELYFSKLNSVNKFKHGIEKEPEFCGINNLSDVELLNFIENVDNKSVKSRTRLTDYQYTLFDDIHTALFGIQKSRDIYDKIAGKIFNKCYI